jgi:hypothetical protein
MKQLLCICAIALLATPVFAQDEGGGGGLPSSLFGGALDAPRGEQPKPMDAVKKFFAQAQVNISGDQERAMRPVVESAFKQVQDTVERLSAAQPGGQPARGQGGERRGGGGGGFDGGQRRGGGRGGQAAGANAAANPQLAAELQKINDEVVPKILAMLKPDQQAAFKKWQNDEIKKNGGFAALKIIMDEAGAPLTEAQEPQIRNLYVEDTQQRQQLRRDGQGTPDPAKIAELEKTTMSKVVRLLTPEQRKALLDSSRTK